MAKQIPTIRFAELSWLKDYVCVGEGLGDASDYYLSREQAKRLGELAALVTVAMKTREDERVYYPARDGELTTAIKGFGLLLRSYQQQAKKRNDKTMYGWCAERVINEQASLMQSRVMSYLPAMIDYDDQENLELLSKVVATYGYRRFKK
jgi:hypothetical protein